MLPSGQRTQQKWFNASVFSQAAPFTFGNVGPYSPDLRGPQTNNWNTSFFKNTNLREGMRLQFSAEFYNLFNHPIWAPRVHRWVLRLSAWWRRRTATVRDN
jgi:hypothetical protein